MQDAHGRLKCSITLCLKYNRRVCFGHPDHSKKEEKPTKTNRLCGTHGHSLPGPIIHP